MLSLLAVFCYPLRHGVNSVLTHKKYLYTLCSSLREQLNTAKGAQPQVKHLFPCVSVIRHMSPHPDPHLPKRMKCHYVKRFGNMFSTFTEKTTQTRQFL